MATATSHNKKSSAVKRILSEARELSQDQSDLYTAAPLEDNIFEWHFTLRGPANTEFADGLYHGRILLPAEYPMRPPNLMLLTPNGRWELNKKICLTFTGFHEEMWQPAWGIRTALLGLQTFMTAKAEAAVGIGSLDYPVQARQKLAAESRRWKCELCEKTTLEMLPDPDTEQSEQGEKERLPEGLHVDLNAQSHKSPASQPQSSSEGNSSASAPIPASPSPDSALPQQQQHSPSPAPPQSDLPAAAPLAPMAPMAPVAAASEPQLQHRRSAPLAPPPRSSSVYAPPPAPSAVPTQATLPNRAISATERKLTLIDNCIKALGILVALLVVKRLL
ncbi:probable UBC6-E2 ubiquitin-conjugating enzyme [Sporisorium reilianum SRZ2]|uniref:Probable UBC6-E2 ubiquitin-conjugating enzyme n=1 Tax=Sporisorium reilianum (strain SRZ2) TaxID=999809 RepID=E7A023_SPORE|nr:probable UBC6-E2 ubiquitin-conjugating enzyme [Sporisorium reilianum SRZ2]